MIDQSTSEKSSVPINLKTSRFIQPLYLISLMLVVASVSSMTYFNIKKNGTISALKTEVRKKKTIVIHDTIRQFVKVHDTIIEPKPAFFVFQYYRHGSQETIKEDGSIIVEGSISKAKDTIPIKGHLLSLIVKRCRQYLKDKKK